LYFSLVLADSALSSFMISVMNCYINNIDSAEDMKWNLL